MISSAGFQGSQNNCRRTHPFAALVVPLQALPWVRAALATKINTSIDASNLLLVARPDRAWICRPQFCCAPWLGTPGRCLMLLIAATLVLRVAFGASLGLGIDESYTVATARVLQLSYYDHPPLTWWLSWGISHITGSEAPIIMRLPFILLFGVTTWLIYILGGTLFGPRAGLWSAVLLNVTPVFGAVAGTWVLPDGPLDCALLGAGVCLVHALAYRPGAALWWCGAGICAGLALLAKYTVILTLLGAFLYLLTQKQHRRWLTRPEPYSAVIIALLLFVPALMWNAEHGWSSFLFQGSRATVEKLRPAMPFVTLAGEAIYILPWIWLPLIYEFVRALRCGPSDRHEWLLASLAIVPIVAFAVISLWAQDRVLYHWATPGYLFLLPLLGRSVAANIDRRNSWVRAWLIGNVITVLFGITLASSEVKWNWLPDVGEKFAPGADPDLQAVDWTSVADELLMADLVARPELIVAGIKWYDTGKLDYALRGRKTVICLCDDGHEYAYLRPIQDYIGRDILIVAHQSEIDEIRRSYGREFDTIDALKQILVWHAGRPAEILRLYLGHRLHLNNAP